jgi:ABC-type cobalamin/Fe3+-siderophores transport system ATPase subunit
MARWFMMTINFDVPLISGGSLQFGLEDGEAVFILGANGTGKSSLLHQFVRQHGMRAHRIGLIDNDSRTVRRNCIVEVELCVFATTSLS